MELGNICKLNKIISFRRYKMVLIYIGEITHNLMREYINKTGNEFKRTDQTLLGLVNRNLIRDIDEFYINNDLFLNDDTEIYQKNYLEVLDSLIIKYCQINDMTYLERFINIIGLEKFKQTILNMDNNIFLTFSLSALRKIANLEPKLSITLAMIDYSHHKNVNFILTHYPQNYLLICALADRLFNKISPSVYKIKDKQSAISFILKVHNYVHIYLKDNILTINK